ncbi:MAG: hypothetical protein JXD23_02365 [Spirochaetales bacterium]|nr:hypothetical protein [Spirochaetales bacterium]
MGFFIYPNRHLVRLTQAHLQIISGFDGGLSFTPVKTGTLLPAPFNTIIRNLIEVNFDLSFSLQGPLPTPRRESQLSIGCVLINSIVRFSSALTPLVVIPGYPSDPHLDPSENAAGVTLKDYGAYILKRDTFSFIHYDTTPTPWNFKPSETTGRKYYFENFSGKHVELPRPEMLFHELAHFDFCYGTAPFLSGLYQSLPVTGKLRYEEVSVINTVNSYRAWKVKKYDYDKLRKPLRLGEATNWTFYDELQDRMVEIMEDLQPVITGGDIELPEIDFLDN